jgi:hypothetical protein
MSNDMNNLLALMAEMSKKGKSNLTGMSSMVNFMDNPFIGMLTGTYNPLSQQSQVNIPESVLYNDIVNDPNAPLTLKRVAQGIVEEGQPVLKIQNEINSMVDDGMYSKDELKSWATQLAAEKADVDRAKNSASNNSVLGKAGFSEYTDQYSDNPDIAPFDEQTRGYISNLKDLASKSRAKGESLGKGFAETSGSGYDPKNIIANIMQRGGLQAVDLPGRLTKSFAEAKKNESGLIDKATAIKLVNEMGSNRDPKKQKAVKEKLFKVISSSDLKPYTKTSKGQFGDLNNPKNLAKYFEWQSAVQSANQLEKQANDYRDTTIAKAEKSGRTPAMDEMAQRMLAIRLATGQ